MILESKEQLKTTPDLVVLAVGGGGLLSGVVEGMHEAGWSRVPLLAVETLGADSFASSVAAKEIITLPGITRYDSYNLYIRTRWAAMTET